MDTSVSRFDSKFGMFFSSMQVGLHISSQSLALAVLRRSGRVCRVEAVQVLALPPGLVRPSPVELNIADGAEFRSCIEKLLKPFGRIRHLALSLPDLSARVALVVGNDPSSLKGADLGHLIRWQMEKLFLSPLGDSKVVYQLLSPSDRSFLAVAIQDRVLQQYEEPLRSMGMEPEWANLASFQIFNLYHDLLMERAGSAPFMVLSYLDQNFVLLAAAEGRLHFVRTKGLLFPSADHEDVRRPEGTDPDLLCDRIISEMNTSLSFYSKTREPSLITHLFVCGRQISDLTKKLQDTYHIEVESLEPERLGFLEGLNKVRPEELSFVIPAVASAIESAMEFSFISGSQFFEGRR